MCTFDSLKRCTFGIAGLMGGIFKIPKRYLIFSNILDCKLIFMSINVSEAIGTNWQSDLKDGLHI